MKAAKVTNFIVKEEWKKRRRGGRLKAEKRGEEGVRVWKASDEPRKERADFTEGRDRRL